MIRPQFLEHGRRKLTVPFGNESRQSVVELRQPLTAVGPKHAIGGPRRSKP